MAAFGETSRPTIVRSTWRLRISNRGRVGATVVMITLVLAVIGPFISPHGPTTALPGLQLLPPSLEFPFGTDQNGMDVFSRVLAAPRTDITIALLGTAGAVIIGVSVGLVAGYASGWPGELMMRFSDVIQAFPVFVLGMAFVVFTGQNITNVIAVIAIVNAPIYVRLTRSQVLVLRERLFIEAARSIGRPPAAILIEHVLPHAITPALANVSITMGFSILLTAGLSFVGAGVRIPTPEWGSMIAIGAQNIYTGEWWASVFPGLALSLTVLGYGLLGAEVTRLRDVTDT